MTPRSISNVALHTPPLIGVNDTVADAVEQLVASRLPALPVIDEANRYSGIFGEREFMEALFPGYLNQLRSTAFLSRSLDEALERRDSCRYEQVGRYVNTEHIDVKTDFSDTQIAEIFLHHRVLIIPVLADRHVEGVITRSDFFRIMVQRFLDGGEVS